MFTSALGFFATCLTVGAFLPQVFRAWQTRQTKDLSAGTLALLLTAGVAWTTYGFLVRDIPVMLSNGAVTLSVVALTAAKIRFG